MHQCLTVPEILSLIFDNFVEPRVESPSIRRHWPFDGTGTLFNLARTKKSFTEPALDRLWFFIPDLILLVQTLHRKTWDVAAVYDEYHQDHDVVMLLHDLKPSHLLRFRYYAQKVHVLGEFFPGQDPRKVAEAAEYQTELHPLVLPVLLARHQGHSILPNLRQFNSRIWHFLYQAWEARAAIPDTITGINLRDLYPSSNSETLSALNTLGKMIGPSTPLLQDLILFSPPTSPTRLHDLPIVLDVSSSSSFSSSLITQLCFLRKLEIFHFEIQLDLLRHLISLSTLRSLETTIPSDAIDQLLNLRPYFACGLQNLTLRTESLIQCTRFIKASAGSTVQSLHFIRTRTSTEKWDVATFAKSISRLDSLSEIRQIQLQAPILTAHPEEISFDITSEAIKPFLSFRRLEGLRLSLNGRVDLDQETLQKMADAWPSLKYLDLHERTTGIQPHITLCDAARLTASLPDLKELHLRVHVPGLDFDDVYNIPPSPNLTCLDVCTSPIPSELGVTGSVTAFLIFTFPELRSVQFGWTYRGMNHEAISNLPDEIERGYHQRWETIGQQFATTFADMYASMFDL